MTAKKEVKVVVTVEMKTHISFWDALKLRLAGGQYIRETVETTIAKGEQ